MTTPVPPEILAAHLSKNAFFSLTHGEIAFVTSQAEVGELGRRRAESDTVQAVERLVAWACDQDGTEPRLCALLGDLGTAWTTTSVLLTRELLNRRDEGEDVPLPIYFDLRDLDTERPPDLGLRTILDHLLRQAAATTAIDVDGALETIRSVHDLYSLARQPVLLSMIRHVLPRVEEALVENRRIRTAELYEEFVEQWLSRDDGKHTLTPDHKLWLMGHLAREVWASGTRTWEASWMEDWMLRCLHDHPEMELHYDERMPTQWKQDFRTATFLSRRQDSFAFAHSSLLEYFLARALADALLEESEDVALSTWDLPQPSAESLFFIGEILDGLDPSDKRHALASLRKVARRGTARARVSVLAYLTMARSKDLPAIPTTSLDLSHTDLRRWSLGSPEEPLDLTGVSLTATNLDDAVLTNVRLDRSDASDASFRRARLVDCTVKNARLDGVDLSGTILRRCDLTGTDLRSATRYRTQYLFSHPAIDLDGVLVAPAREHALPPVTQSFQGASPDCHTVIWGSDNTRILTADSNGAHIWDATTGEEILTLTKTDTLICTTAWSSDNTRIVTAGNGSAHIWDATTGEEILTLTNTWASTVAWNSDVTRFLAAGKIGANIWDTNTGETILTLTSASIYKAAWSPDNTHIVTTGFDGTHVWDATTGQQTFTLTNDQAQAMAWSPNSTQIAMTNSRGVQVWDATTGQQTLTLTETRAEAVAWSPDNAHILVSGHRKGVQVWDATTGEQTLILTERSTRKVAWSPDNTHILTTGDNGTHIWDTTTGQQTFTITNTRTKAVAWSSDNTHILTTGDNGTHVWDATTGERTLSLNTISTETVAWSPDNTKILTGVFGRTDVWDATTGEHTLTLGASSAEAVVWSPDNTKFLTNINGVHIWDAAAAEHIDTIAEVGLERQTWSPDNTRILNSCHLGVQVLDTSGKELSYFFTPLKMATWSSDSIGVLAVGHDGARIWDATTGEQILTLTDRYTSAASWSPDNTRILTTGDDGTHIWNATTGERILTLTNEFSQAASWSPDNTRIVTSGPHGTRAWDATNGEPVGVRIDFLPEGETVVRDAVSLKIIGASPEAWRWLGCQTMVDGMLTRLPAEINGPLPPLKHASS